MSKIRSKSRNIVQLTKEYESRKDDLPSIYETVSGTLICFYGEDKSKAIHNIGKWMDLYIDLRVGNVPNKISKTYANCKSKKLK